MNTWHVLPASFPLAPALPVSGESWFPQPRGRQERFPTVPMPHRGQRGAQSLDSTSVLPLCPSPCVQRPISDLLLGSAGFPLCFCSRKSCGWTHCWGKLGMLQTQLGRGTQLPSWGEVSPWLHQELPDKREEMAWTQLTPCPFLLHRTPQGAKRA